MTQPLPQNWQKVMLGDIGKVSMCKRIMKNQTSTSGGIPFFKIGTFGREPDAFIPVELYREYKEKYSFPKKGEILLSAAGTIGRAVIYNGSPAYFQDSNIVWLSNDEKHASNAFLRHVYKCVKWKTANSTIARLYNDNLRKISISLPPLPEQHRIVAILETWDKAIAELEKKIDLKKKMKRGLERRLLTNKTRLPGFKDKWETVKMSSLFDRISRTTASKESLKSYSISSKIGFETQEEKYSRVMSGKSLDKYILLKKGEFAYNKGNSITYPHGCIYEFEENEGLVPFVYICFKNKGKVSSSFYRHYFLQRLLDKELKAHITTSVRGNGLLNISPEDFFSCKVLNPPLDEQNAIASVLDTMDAELDALLQKMELMKQQKVFLLNNLISGRIRTPENMPIPKS